MIPFILLSVYLGLDLLLVLWSYLKAKHREAEKAQMTLALRAPRHHDPI